MSGVVASTHQRNQIAVVSLPAPNAWTRPSTQTTTVARWALRQSLAPIRCGR